MTTIDHLVVYQPELERVPASVFFIDDREGTVRGLYFGDAGSGTSDEAYFRMEVSDGGATRFLECDRAEEPAFRIDRVHDGRRRPPAVSAADAAVFAGLCSYRRIWWAFAEDDYVRMDAVRATAMQPVDGVLLARSRGLRQETLGLIRQYGSLRGF